MGCGKDYTGLIGQSVTIATSGVKALDCSAKTSDGVSRCGAWSLDRKYIVYLPANYDTFKPYPLVFEAPGCGGNAGGVYGLPGARDNVIRIGLTPPPSSIGHATNPDQGCFDDREGDDSVDFVFYETLYDKLNELLCFDRNRVFAVGTNSGEALANELGCRYAGDTHGRPIRGVASYAGLLPTEAEYTPTCTSKPMAGLWAYNVDVPGGSSPNPSYAVARALQVNGCVGAPNMEDAFAEGLIENFPIGSGKADDTCKLLKGCPELYPLVVCDLPRQQQSSFDSVVEAAASTFLSSFVVR